MDFQELYMSFFKDSHNHFLQGIKSNPLNIINSKSIENILKKGHLGIIAKLHSIKGCVGRGIVDL